MADSDRFDLIIRGGTLVDGSGAPRRRADVGVRAGAIASIGALDGARASTDIDASGRIVAPGFIDVHTHDDRLLLSDPDMAPKASQGVTTVVAGNCGISLACSQRNADATITAPLDLLSDDGAWFRFPSFRAYREELDARPAALNAACLIGHTTLRVATMDRLDRPASRAERARMRSLVREALESGAIGLSTGTAYAPAAAAPMEEIVDICSPLAEFGGVYATHMRNEDDAIVDAMEETFQIGRDLGVPVIVSHHKCVGTRNHGRSPETLALLERARSRQAVSLDCYPYIASSTVIRADRLAQSTRVVVTWSKPHPEFAGLDLPEVARRLGVDVATAVERIKPAGAIYFMLDEADVRRILAYDDTMIGSDGLPHDAKPHPRLWGTFPRVLGHYCRDAGLFTLETAVRKMTAIPATRFGLAGRGLLAPGNVADITIFDAATIKDTATFEDPIQPAAGIDQVLVAGTAVWSGGRATGERPGRLLTRPGR